MHKKENSSFTGLSEKEVLESREKHGSNKLPEPKLPTWKDFALDTLKEPITIILIVMTVLELILSILGVDSITAPMMTLILIALVTSIAVKTNLSIQKATENLRRKTATRYCEVIRDGKVLTINKDDLVVGDIALDHLGQEIYADGYLVDGKLSINNAAINGESEECQKTPIEGYVYEKDESTEAYKNQNHLFAGTTVVAGEGIMEVTTVGKDTVNGETLMNMQTLEDPKTALDIALDQSGLAEKTGDKGLVTSTTQKKNSTTTTTENTSSNNDDDERDDDVISGLNDLIYDYENLEIQNDSDLAQLDSMQGEIEQLLSKLKTKDNQKFYRSVYEQAKTEVQGKVQQYKNKTGQLLQRNKKEQLQQPLLNQTLPSHLKTQPKQIQMMESSFGRINFKASGFTTRCLFDCSRSTFSQAIY